MDFAREAAELLPYIQNHRRHIHQYPELSFREKETTEYIQKELESMGIEVIRFSDYYGLIGVLKGGRAGKTVLLRADIDALGIREENELDFCSVHAGVMHACGHDCHSAMLLGAAKILSAYRDALKGTVKFLFQSAEESGHGANYYVDHGCLDGVDAAMAIHMMNEIPEGPFSIEAGPRMASCTDFTLTVHGTATHGSMPHLGHDAIVAASAVIMNLQTLVSRQHSPLRPLVVSIGSVRAGSQFNIVADEVVMKGTIRTFDRDLFASMPKRLEAMAKGTAEAMGCHVSVAVDTSEPAAINDYESIRLAAHNAVETLYGDCFASMKQKMGSEDFAVIMEKVPSVLCFLGYHNEEKGTVYPLHSKDFRVNDEILDKGAALFAKFAYDYLEKEARP